MTDWWSVVMSGIGLLSLVVVIVLSWRFQDAETVEALDPEVQRWEWL